jgi:hypothetical protein
MSGSERGAASIDVDDDDPGTAGEAGTAAGAVVGFESAAPTRPEHRRLGAGDSPLRDPLRGSLRVESAMLTLAIESIRFAASRLL